MKYSSCFFILFFITASCEPSQKRQDDDFQRNISKVRTEKKDYAKSKADLEKRKAEKNKDQNNSAGVLDAGVDSGEGIKSGTGVGSGEGIKSGTGVDSGEGIKSGTGVDSREGIKSGTGVDSREEGGKPGEGGSSSSSVKTQFEKVTGDTIGPLSTDGTVDSVGGSLTGGYKFKSGAAQKADSSPSGSSGKTISKITLWDKNKIMIRLLGGKYCLARAEDKIKDYEEDNGGKKVEAVVAVCDETDDKFFFYMCLSKDADGCSDGDKDKENFAMIKPSGSDNMDYCLDVYSFDYSSGRLKFYECHGKPNQRFKMAVNDEGGAHLFAKGSNNCHSFFVSERAKKYPYNCLTWITGNKLQSQKCKFPRSQNFQIITGLKRYSRVYSRGQEVNSICKIDK